MSVLKFFSFILFFCFMVSPSVWALHTEQLASRVAESIRQLSGEHYQTVAISRIKQRNQNQESEVNELIDYIGVKIVRTRRFRVTDRTKLQLILNEQRIQLSDVVTPNEYRQLGKVLGVQLFIYGTLYDDALVLKAIDVQNSAIVWADIFTLNPNSIRHLTLMALGNQTAESLQKESQMFQGEKIRNISFWSIDTNQDFDSQRVMDYLTAILYQKSSLVLIDRENLKLLAQEQALNQEAFIDESEARKLGQLYGVDAFLYGNITAKNTGHVASFKMMNIFTGVLLWADLLRFEPQQPKKQELFDPFASKQQGERQEEPSHIGMALIQGGTFQQGSDDPSYNAAPTQYVRVRSFWLDLYEVSNADYLKFVREKRHREPIFWKNGQFEAYEAALPVVGVSWEDASLYCQFMDKRLPTESEWEYAARGTEGRKFTWAGVAFSPAFTITTESGKQSSEGTRTVNRDTTPEGVRHLSGNVREFVADDFRFYYDSSSQQTDEKVVKGSSWAYSSYEAAGFFRGRSKLNLAWPDVGFRCARNENTRLAR